MKNYVAPGKSVTATVPGGGVTSGQPIASGVTILVASMAASAGKQIEFYTEGVFELPAQAGTYGLGQRVLWDVSANSFAPASTTPATGDFWAGVAYETKTLGGGGGTVKIKINVPAPVPTA